METGSLNLSANDIIQELSENEELKKVIHNIAGNDPYLKDELYQATFQILCSKKPEFIEKKYYDEKYAGRFTGYVIRIAQREFHRSKTEFTKEVKSPLKYNDIESIPPEKEILDDEESFLRVENNERLGDLLDEINRMSHCPRTTETGVAYTLLNAFLRNNCNVTKTAKEFRISKDYVRLRLTEIKKKLKEELLKKSQNRNL